MRGRVLGTQKDDEENNSKALKMGIEAEECWWDVFTEEILPGLPAKQLQTLKIVCKNWYRIISSPNFVGLHLKIYNESRIRVIVRNEGRLIEYKFNINSSDVEETKQLRRPPSIRRSSSSLWVPAMACSVCTLKVRVVQLRCIIHPRVYFSFHERIGTLLHGAIHWSAQRNPRRSHSLRRQVIYAYHLDDNKYLEISPPIQPPRDFNLGVAEGCLFAILRPTNAQVVGEFEMWIMKDYGVEESWMKYANIRGLNSFGDLNCHSDVAPLGFFPNGDLILDVDRYMLMKYNFNDNKAELLTHREYGNTIICADSLESPKIVGT